MYIYIAAAAYFVTIFLTVRDIRIYRRTAFASYRKGATRGIIASTIILIGVLIVSASPNIGLLFVLIGLFVNKKGVREKIFTDATAFDRLLGKTDIMKEDANPE
ncbi:hypothetical protein J2755_000209 [Methanohalophilus levihalophilus]|uniref:hypothetical protein n=1 Tax=Methanohalophilus levihalophilus TaxID=1431282 RepID=UPI001AE91318|nr:hypothetical protein [Methanohalophilus levihalophilus]MBP2029289.1 hypothetical protein [Methanohalophilus levihalophilus]